MLSIVNSQSYFGFNIGFNKCKKIMVSHLIFNTLRLRQNGWHFSDDIFKCIFLNEDIWISKTISLKFILKGPINNNPALVQIMAWRCPGDKPLSEPMVLSLLTHNIHHRPQWVKCIHWLKICLRYFSSTSMLESCKDIVSLQPFPQYSLQAVAFSYDGHFTLMTE